MINVNFTTYPKRDKYIYKMLSRFKNQTLKPDRIVLWLCEEEYDKENLPETITRCKTEGLLTDIMWVPKNIKAHKKHGWVNLWQDEYNITIDDDLYYRPNFVEEMVKKAKLYPNAVIVESGWYVDYNRIDRIRQKVKGNENPSIKNGLRTGICCFPPNTFPMEALEYSDLRDKYVPSCDESWIGAFLIKNDIPIYIIRNEHDLIGIDDSQKIALWKQISKTNSNGVSDRMTQFSNAIKIAGIKEKVKKIWPLLDVDFCSTYKDGTEKSYEKGISICITAFKAKEYIKETLDTIMAQTWFKDHDNWEVLIGIDGCYETLEYLQSIMDNYKNLRIFMMKSNKGTYVTSNTIMSIAKYDSLLRFDSDDTMEPNLIETVMQKRKNADMLIFQMVDYDGENIGKPRPACGQKYIKHSIFDEFGGFRDYRCGADWDLDVRLNKFVNVVRLNDVLMKRRLHGNNLTMAAETNFKSDYRKKIIREIELNNLRYFKRADAYIGCVTNGYDEIFSDTDISKYPKEAKIVYENPSSMKFLSGPRIDSSLFELPRGQRINTQGINTNGKRITVNGKVF